MTYEINETHDPNLKSWVESANDPKTDFPIQNLPYAFHFDETGNGLATIIGDQRLNLWRCVQEGLFDEAVSTTFRDDFVSASSLDLNDSDQSAEDFRKDLTSFRRRLSQVLHENTDAATRESIRRFLVPLEVRDSKCHFRLATTPTSTALSTTRRMSDRCFGRIIR